MDFGEFTTTGGLHNDVDVTVIFEIFKHFHDVGVIHGLEVGDFLFDLLDRVVASLAFVDGLQNADVLSALETDSVDDAKSTFTQLLHLVVEIPRGTGRFVDEEITTDLRGLEVLVDPVDDFLVDLGEVFKGHLTFFGGVTAEERVLDEIAREGADAEIKIELIAELIHLIHGEEAVLVLVEAGKHGLHAVFANGGVLDNLQDAIALQLLSSGGQVVGPSNAGVHRGGVDLEGSVLDGTVTGGAVGVAATELAVIDGMHGLVLVVLVLEAFGNADAIQDVSHVEPHVGFEIHLDGLGVIVGGDNFCLEPLLVTGRPELHELADSRKGSRSSSSLGAATRGTSTAGEPCDWKLQKFKQIILADKL